MTIKRPRPDGWDYDIPDPEEIRCPECNPDGMNRTGLKPWGYIGTSTTSFYANRCKNNCNNGIIQTSIENI